MQAFDLRRDRKVFCCHDHHDESAWIIIHFLQLTYRPNLDRQRKIALKCGVAIIVIMFATIWLGSELLNLLGITLASFRFAGDIILLLTGLSMLHSKETAINHTALR